MDMPINGVRPVELEIFSTPKHLEHASEQARARNYQDFLIVDVDSHHYENEHYGEVFQYIQSPVIRAEAMAGAGRRTGFLNSQVGYQNTGGRVHRQKFRGAEREKARPGGKHTDITLTLDWMDAMGDAYNAWLCERILAQEPRIVSMLYLPFNDPEAAYKTVKKFGDKKGVVGFMVTSPRYRPVHDNAYMKTYALLE